MCGPLGASVVADVERCVRIGVAEDWATGRAGAFVQVPGVSPAWRQPRKNDRRHRVAALDVGPYRARCAAEHVAAGDGALPVLAPLERGLDVDVGVASRRISLNAETS